MKTYLNEKQVAAMTVAVNEQVDCETAREIAVAIGLNNTEGIPQEIWIPKKHWRIAYAFRSLFYKNSDTGINGKMIEVADRLDNSKATALPWAEFSAHKPGKYDNRFRRLTYERKTGTGRWFTTATLEEGIRDTLNHKKWIWFTYECGSHYIEIITTYDKWWEILATYNAKGVITWFKYNKSRAEWDFQTLNTSDKKMRWLEAHNCDDRP